MFRGASCHPHWAAVEGGALKQQRAKAQGQQRGITKTSTRPQSPVRTSSMAQNSMSSYHVALSDSFDRKWSTTAKCASSTVAAERMARARASNSNGRAMQDGCWKASLRQTAMPLQIKFLAAGKTTTTSSFGLRPSSFALASITGPGGGPDDVERFDSKEASCLSSWHRPSKSRKPARMLSNPSEHKPFRFSKGNSSSDKASSEQQASNANAGNSARSDEAAKSSSPSPTKSPGSHCGSAAKAPKEGAGSSHHCCHCVRCHNRCLEADARSRRRWEGVQVAEAGCE
mmetsp:Transcript_108645/g.337533  ORF Transcript_108645/g.337533 Transcript_108645/m.337533 type:complete len:286 (-) Transcript_108645:230-1087(-)